MKDTSTLVTNRIIAERESGTVLWHKPWTCPQPADIVDEPLPASPGEANDIARYITLQNAAKGQINITSN